MGGLLTWFVHSHKHTYVFNLILFQVSELCNYCILKPRLRIAAQPHHILFCCTMTTFLEFLIVLVRESLHVAVSTSTAVVHEAVTGELDEIPLL